MRKLAGVIIISLCTIAAMTAQTVQDTASSATPQPQASQPAKTNTGDPRADLAKMRILLGQMQRNVGFVSAGDTPLKHQFELEIEMWQILIHDMEEKLNAQQSGQAK